MNPRDKYLEALATGSHTHIIGADECGYGAWAGPLMVCAAVVPKGWKMSGLNDSKKLKTVAKREDVFYDLGQQPLIRFATAQAEVPEINEFGLGAALKRCYLEAIGTLRKTFPEALVVIDGEVQVSGLEYLHFPRADEEVPAVMAASVFGKVTRDRQMVKLASVYPGYGVGDHFGYGTEQHEAALKKKGMSPIHRHYTPMDRILSGKRGRKGPVGFEDDVEFE